MQSSLELLLGHASKDVFFRDAFEREPRVFEQSLDASDIDALFSVEYLDRIFANVDFRHPHIEIIEEGVASKPPTLPRGSIDRVSFLRKIRRGSSMRIRDVQMIAPQVMRFCRQLSRELSGFVNVNVYVTPPGRQAFRPHYDSHDVFIVQCFGDKHWVINRSYDRQTELPNERVLPADDDPRRKSNPATEEKICLRKGDVLYLPRGTLHYASASDTGSIHITIAYYPITWGQIIHYAVKHAEKTDRSFRTIVSPLIASESPECNSELVERFLELLQKVDFSHGLAAARQAIAGACPEPCDRRLMDIFDPVQIDASTEMTAHADAHYTVDWDADGSIAGITIHDARLVFDADERILFKRLQTYTSFTPRDLVVREEDLKPCIRFLEQLFREGVVSIAAVAQDSKKVALE